MPPRSRRLYNDAELTSAVEHLAFDVHHFRCYGAAIGEHRLWQAPPTVRQAVIYSLLIHLRVLLDFFYKAPREDDCHAENFRSLEGFDQSFPLDLVSNSARALEVARNLNKRLAHMTATRWKDKAPMLDYYTEFAPEIETLLNKFEMGLTEPVRTAFRSKLVYWQSVHDGTLTNKPPSL